ncbi:hypothetical protein IG631_02474 [Alternaria alternata]|nr:hypothetical protein IG631_02474 [Alternaria alternata]
MVGGTFACTAAAYRTACWAHSAVLHDEPLCGYAVAEQAVIVCCHLPHRVMTWGAWSIW